MLIRNRISIAVLSLLIAGLACNAPGGENPTPAPISEATTAPPGSASTATPSAAQPTATLPPQNADPVRINFAAGATSASVQGTLNSGETHSYVLGAVVAQTMTVNVTASGGMVSLKVVTPGGLMVLDPAAGQTSWSAPLPETGDYTLSVVHLSGGSAPYTMTVEIPPVETAQCWATTTRIMTAWTESSPLVDIFGSTQEGDTMLALARTNDGWLGFDPGVAQAGNSGRARLRWFDTTDGGVTYDPAGCENNLPLVLSLESLQNGSYKVFGQHDITLTEGQYTNPDFNQLEDAVHDTFMGTARGFGDMNGDGSEDAVIVLATNTGGSGTFVEIVLVLNINGDPQQVPGYQVGDREPVHTLTIDDGILTTDVTVHDADDGFCCPSVEETWHLKLENGALVRID
jgi:hypothetical protein